MEPTRQAWRSFQPVGLRLDHLFQTLPKSPEPTPASQPEEPPLLDIDPALLEPGLITDVRVDLSSRCNLRCVYCAVSLPDYRGEDMPRDIVHRATGLIRRLARYNEISGLGINGHGETTFLPDWTQACRELTALGLPVTIITNLAKAYSVEELEALAALHTISVSIDTADRDLLRRIRRRADVRQIVSNIALIRATALRLRRTAPRFQFFCGLYDRNTLQLEDLAWLAVALNIRKVQFWDLFVQPRDGADIPEQDRVYPLAALSDQELRPRLAVISRAIGILRQAAVEVEIDGPFIAELEARVGVHV